MAIEFKEGKEIESHLENTGMMSCPFCSQGDEKIDEKIITQWRPRV
jgi:hypothetical protein